MEPKVNHASHILTPPATIPSHPIAYQMSANNHAKKVLKEDPQSYKSVIPNLQALSLEEELGRSLGLDQPLQTDNKLSLDVLVRQPRLEQSSKGRSGSSFRSDNRQDLCVRYGHYSYQSAKVCTPIDVLHTCRDSRTAGAAGISRCVGRAGPGLGCSGGR